MEKAQLLGQIQHSESLGCLGFRKKSEEERQKWNSTKKVELNVSVFGFSFDFLVNEDGDSIRVF